MKISYNWLKQFITTDLSPGEVSKILTAIGLEVESLELVQPIRGGLEGLVIGQVNTCRPHPNADRLKITTVTVGAGNDLQIVCGAPNVSSLQKVIVAVPGTTIYPLTGDPIKITRSRIRGEVSEGMICAEDEIGIGNSHDGIIVLDDAAIPGTLAKNWFQLADDHIFEIGLTPNRADAASHLGVARDLAAFLRIDCRLPATSLPAITNHELPVPVIVENERSCPRYSSLTLTGVTVKTSPNWLKEKLNSIGVRPVNNIVDVTNYVLHDLGQPLHAFDAGKIKGGKIVVKHCAEGTSFITLDGVTRKLSAQDLMICDALEPLCIAGVFGGQTSGITEDTVSVFLESACFDPVTVRKTAKRLGLKTDASFRFERGTDPDMTVIALTRAALLIMEVAGGKISSEIADFYPSPVPFRTINVSYQHIARLLGKEIPANEIREILESSGNELLAESAGGFTLGVPPYKVDVTREADVIEEILRLYGYNNIAIPGQVRASLSYTVKPDPELVGNQAADLLAGNGFFEILTNSLTSSQNILDKETEVAILNPLSNELDVMRQTLLFSGLEVIAFNQKRKTLDLKLFEFGKTYFKLAEKYTERSGLALFITGMKEQDQWNQPPSPQTFFDLKAVADALLGRFNLAATVSSVANNPLFSYGISYMKGEKTLMTIGAVSKSALDRVDVSGEVFYGEIDWALLLKLIRNNTIRFKDISKYPPVRRDLSVLIDRSVQFADLEKIARKTDKKMLKEINIFDVYEGEHISENKKSYALSFTLQDDEHTLTDKQIDSVMQKIIANFEKEAGAEIRK